MSDRRRRRRRSQSEDESEQVPAQRRRYYHTRSAARDEENRRTSLLRSHFSNSSGSSVNVVRIPIVDFRRYPRLSAREQRRNGSRRERTLEEAGTSGRTTHTSARSQDSSSRMASDGPSTSSGPSTSGTHRPRSIPQDGGTSRGEPRRRRSAERPDDVPRSRINYLQLVRRIRTYAAMSTGGQQRADYARRAFSARTDAGPSTSRARSSGRAGARLMRATTSHDVPSGSGEHRPQARRRRRSNNDFDEVIRSLNLVPREENTPPNLRRLLERRRMARANNLPRPIRGANILRSSGPVRISAQELMRRQENQALNTLIRAYERRPYYPRAGARTRALTTFEDNQENIAYNMTHDRNGINIRVAFGADDDDDSEPNNQTFSFSGESDATTYLNSVSDADMSTDDVFYSDSDRMESDSGESIESASTATPHSLVSLSLNALHPSPTPSLSSAETDDVNEDEDDAEDEGRLSPTLERAIITSMRNVGNPIIFMHNNISVQFLTSMAELADVFATIRTRFRVNNVAENAPEQAEGGFTPPRFNHLEPTRRRVPEGVDCQRAKLIDELNSNTAECVICTDTIRGDEQVWPCNNCFNIFHLPCIRRWAKTNRDTEMGGAWICPVCRRPKFCSPNKLRYRCLCGRRAKPKPLPGVTPHCCGKKCKHNCGLLCHPGPCKMTEAETAAVSVTVSKEASTSQVAPTPHPVPPASISEEIPRSVIMQQ